MQIRRRLNLVTALVGMISGFVGSLFFIAYDLYIQTLAPPVGGTDGEALIPAVTWSSLALRDSWILLLVVLFSALLAMLVSRYFNAAIADPIVRLADASREVTQKHNFSLRLTHTGKDEVGQLVTAFNEMMAMIENRDADLRSAHDLFDRFMSHSPAVAIIKDTELRYMFINDAGLFMLGRERNAIVGKTDLELWPEEVAIRLRELDKVALSEGTLGLHSLRQVELIPTDHGDMYYSLVRFRLYDSVGNSYLGCSGLDVTERLQAEQALKASEERYALAVRGASDGMWDWDVVTQEAYFSDRCSEILCPRQAPKESGSLPDPQGPAQRAVPVRLGTAISDLQACIHVDDVAAFQRALDGLVDGSSEQLSVEFRLRKPSKQAKGIEEQERWALTRATALRKSDGTASRVAGFVTDISQRKAEEAQLRRDAFHDSLTGLPNRALFIERLGRAIERSRRHPEDLFAVLFLDLDGFKAVNDTLGHGVGDQLLVATAKRLQKQVRGDDTVARLGGDEFTVLLQELRGTSDVVLVCERLIAALREPVEAGQQSLRIGTSVGVALSTTNYQRPEQMLADSDAAMYLAKRSGKSTFRIFDAEMHRQAEARLGLENQLRQALAESQLILYYQPIVRLSDRRIVAVEALLRWLHPERGVLEPPDFLATAEDTGLLMQIGQSTIPGALARWSAWRESEPELGLYINMSVRQFQHPGVVSRWLDLARKAGVQPDGITLEITERALARDAAGGRATLKSLADLGFGLALDDFGRGSSSLDLIRDFPFTTVKIDQGFVSTLAEGSASNGVAQGLVQLTVGLKRLCIAEGIETALQSTLMQEAGCQLGQGHFYSKPVPAEEIEALLASQSQPVIS